MALVALRGLLPNLSGLIREHAVFFIDNDRSPLGNMPLCNYMRRRGNRHAC
jgi:hypothetical protein